MSVLMNKWTRLDVTYVEQNSMKTHGLLCLADHEINKFDYQHHKTCPNCFHCVSHGKTLTEMKKWPWLTIFLV